MRRLSPPASSRAVALRAQRSYVPTAATDDLYGTVSWAGFGRLLRRTVIGIGLAASVASAGLIAWGLQDLPSVETPAAVGRRPSVALFDTQGRTIGEVGDQYGDSLSWAEIPNALKNAVIATEDRRFFSHFGIDPIGLARATWHNLRAGGVVEGGSTITQQLAKMLFLQPDRTLKRKVQEVLLAVQLEARYAKQDILAIYLNRAYFGAGAYGIDAASRRYFGKSARDVDLSQAALLAGLLKAPSRYNPLASRTLATKRTGEVLSNMVEAGMIAKTVADQASGQVPTVVAAAKPGGGGYFGDWVLEQVRGMPETWGRDVSVVTTLDPALQEAVAMRTREILAESGDKRKVEQSAVVLMTPDGAVRAMVGGRDYGASPFNRAVAALRQPGSAFKMFVYLAALESGLKPDDRVLDAPVRLGDWSPDNYTGKYKGEVTLRTALADSLNSAAVRLLEKAGIRQVLSAAQRLGIERHLRRDATLALGSSEVSLIEMTDAFAVLAAGGQKGEAHGILEIRARDTGEVLYRHRPATTTVVAREVVAGMHDMLGETLRSGTAKAAVLDRPAAGKTGTSQDYRDAWFVGYTADLVAGVWMGNDDGSSMDKVVGGSLPAKLWHDVMKTAHAGLPARPLAVPEAVQLAATPLQAAAPAERDLFEDVIKAITALPGKALSGY